VRSGNPHACRNFVASAAHLQVPTRNYLRTVLRRIHVHAGRLHLARRVYAAHLAVHPGFVPRNLNASTGANNVTSLVAVPGTSAPPRRPPTTASRRPRPPFATSVSSPDSARNCPVYLSPLVQLRPSSQLRRGACALRLGKLAGTLACSPRMDRGSTDATRSVGTSKIGPGLGSTACERVGGGHVRGERARLDLFLPGAATHYAGRCFTTPPGHSSHTSASRFARTTSQRYSRSRLVACGRQHRSAPTRGKISHTSVRSPPPRANVERALSHDWGRLGGPVTSVP
jgi:hypothetical protein